MLIKFLEIRRISEDANVVRLCEKDEIYNIADTAARAAIRGGWAREPNLHELSANLERCKLESENNFL